MNKQFFSILFGLAIMASGCKKETPNMSDFKVIKDNVLEFYNSSVADLCTSGAAKINLSGTIDYNHVTNSGSYGVQKTFSTVSGRADYTLTFSQISFIIFTTDKNTGLVTQSGYVDSSGNIKISNPESTKKIEVNYAIPSLGVSNMKGSPGTIKRIVLECP